MDHSKIYVKMGGHSLELLQDGNRVGGAHYCWTCESGECVKIARFNENYEVKMDPASHKGWHVIQTKEK